MISQNNIMSQQKSISIIPYESQINWFKLFLETEEKLYKYEYEKYPPDILWMSHKKQSSREDDDKFYYLLYCRNLIKMRKGKTHNVAEHLRVMDKLNSSVSVEDFPWAFITLNFDDSSSPTIKQIVTAATKVLEKSYFINVLMVIEKHRQDGIHLHAHLLIKFDKLISPTRVIDGVFALKAVQAVCREKNFIDYLGPQKKGKYHAPYSVYYDYVRGIKKPEKMPFVEQDRKWRDENNIPHLYEK